MRDTVQALASSAASRRHPAGTVRGQLLKRRQTRVENFPPKIIRPRPDILTPTRNDINDLPPDQASEDITSRHTRTGLTYRHTLTYKTGVHAGGTHMFRKFGMTVAALVLVGCTQASAGPCKPDKIKIGMTEAEVFDVCGCGEPDDRVEDRSATGTRVELTFLPQHRDARSYAYGGVTFNGSSVYTPPPRTETDTVKVRFADGKVDMVSKIAAWSGAPS